jgi:hypothetical protein
MEIANCSLLLTHRLYGEEYPVLRQKKRDIPVPTWD